MIHEENTLEYQKKTLEIINGGALSIEERLLLLEIDSVTKDEIIAELKNKVKEAPTDEEGKMFVFIAEKLLKKLSTQNIDIAAERALGNPLE